MKFQLSTELESCLRAVVQNGQFASLDDAVAHAIRLFLNECSQRRRQSNPGGDQGYLVDARDSALMSVEIVTGFYGTQLENCSVSAQMALSGS